MLIIRKSSGKVTTVVEYEWKKRKKGGKIVEFRLTANEKHNIIKWKTKL